MQQNLDGLIWVLVLLGPLVVLQRCLHRETQAVFLLVTRRREIALVLFALLLFPGVLLHESSHFIMARLLGVRTGRFSLLPRPTSDGRLQLGFVETATVDWVRDALIGLAPLITGGLFVAYAGLSHMGLVYVWQQLLGEGLFASISILPNLTKQPDFWLWFYVTFVISSTMLPSPSDRRAWLPLFLAAGLLLGISLLAGAGPWLLINLAPLLNQVLLVIAGVFGISIFLHALLLLPAWGIRNLLSHLTGLRVM